MHKGRGKNTCVFRPEATQALVFCTDQNGQILSVNPSFCQCVGLDEPACLLQTVFDVFPSLCAEELKGHLSAGHWQAEVVFVPETEQKTASWFRASVSRDENKESGLTFFNWVMLDITDLKEREKEQLQRQNRLTGLLDNMPAYVYSKNKDGKYTYINQMLASLHAMAVEEIIGRTDWELFPKDHARNFVENDRLVFEKRRTVRALEDGLEDEYGIKRHFLSVKCPIEDEKGEVIELLGMSVDISEQVRLEKALWESQEKLNNILDNMNARVSIKDNYLHYTYANEELCKVLQKDRNSIVGKSDYDLFETETAIGFRTTDQEVLDTARKVTRLERSVEPGTKEKKYYWSVKVPLFDAEGRITSVLGISTDVTEQKRMERQLRRNESQLTTILDNLKAHVYIKDTNHRYTYVNANMCEYLDRDRDEVLGKTDEEVFGKKAGKKFQATDRLVFDEMDNVTNVEKSRNRKTGEKRYFLSVKVPLINDLGNPYALLGISTDVTQQKRLEKELRQMASTDVLTGTNNRRFFLELCEKEIKRAKRYEKDLSLIMLDMDYFKRINDTYGHAVGDEAIRTMTGLCRQNLRESDVLGRIGGEEFAILLPETDRKGAWHIAQRIRKNTEEHGFDIGESNPCRFTASFGLTCLEKGDETPDDILKRADIALYEAKTQGRNRVCEK